MSALNCLKKGQYDKVILTYLASYYCGATSDMKMLWREARDYEVHTHKLAERILTQMLFSEELFQEAQVFEQYYAEGAYFRLQQAYLVYMSREYVVEEKKNQQECDRYPSAVNMKRARIRSIYAK
mgnify:CR=1 FL=1